MNNAFSNLSYYSFKSPFINGQHNAFLYNKESYLLVNVKNENFLALNLTAISTVCKVYIGYIKYLLLYKVHPSVYFDYSQNNNSFLN